jgi:hypothetical protein
LNRLCIHRHISQLPGLGSPIRKSPDQRLLASPRGISQLATSFIAYLRQGIHTHALSSLTIKLTLRFEFSLRPAIPVPNLADYQIRPSQPDSAIRLIHLISRTCYLQPCSCPSITIQFSKIFRLSPNPKLFVSTNNRKQAPIFHRRLISGVWVHYCSTLPSRFRGSARLHSMLWLA